MPSSGANPYSKAAKRAAELTNKQLADELATLVPMSRDKLNELLPKKADKQAFADLMSIVKSEKELDEKLSYLSQNLKTAGGVIVNLLGSIF